MSHAKIKAISIKQDGVYITSAANNVQPRCYSKCRVSTLSNMLETKGLDAVQEEILEQFYNGNFQGGSTIYSKIARLHNKQDALVMLKRYQSDKRGFIVQNGSNYISRTTARRAFLTQDEAKAKVYKHVDAALIAMRFKNSEIQSI